MKKIVLVLILISSCLTFLSTPVWADTHEILNQRNQVLNQKTSIYDRSIEDISFTLEDESASNRQTVVQVKWSTFTVCPTNNEANYNTDIQIRVNGNLVETIAQDYSFQGNTNECYLEGTKCAGKGCTTGVCFIKFQSCGCKEIIIAKPSKAQPLKQGDIVRVTLVPARGGVQEVDRGDNSLEVTVPRLIES